MVGVLFYSYNVHVVCFFSMKQKINNQILSETDKVSIRW